jgi:Putative prokaryotic signal transducing protein
VGVFQSILEGHGIRCRIRNEYLSAGMGDLPPIECRPQLYVADDDFAEAKRIVEEAFSAKEMTAWKCDPCGEEIEGQFTECWKCGKGRPSADK